MKRSLFIFALILFFGEPVLSQTGVIYNLAFRIDDELTTQTAVQNKDHKILNVATIEEMPKELSDTIALISERLMSDVLKSEVSSLMPEEKLIMAALPQHLMYLPANSLNKAIKTVKKDYYISINCYIAASGGTTISFGNESFSKVKPKVTLNIDVFDGEKNKIKEGKVVLKDFEKLRSHSFENTYSVFGLNETTDNVTVSETLNSNDILRMYLMALEQVTFE